MLTDFRHPSGAPEVRLPAAEWLATRVVYLEDGEIHADLPTARFFDGGLTGRAQQFLKGEMT